MSGAAVKRPPRGFTDRRDLTAATQCEISGSYVRFDIGADLTCCHPSAAAGRKILKESLLGPD